MTLEKVLIVEDDRLVAEDICSTLRRSGYAIIDIVHSGEAAIQSILHTPPDLVLMDIVLEGHMDGIEASEEIWNTFNIPSLYLTAYDDANTMQRVKSTEFFGYLVKPFNERQLVAAIDIALYQYEAEKKKRDAKPDLLATLEAIGDAVLVCNRHGRVTLLNPAAEQLTGWTQDRALGKDVTEILPITYEGGYIPVIHPIQQAMGNNKVIHLMPGAFLLTRDGERIPISDSVAPIQDMSGVVTGAVIVFQHIREPMLPMSLMSETYERLKYWFDWQDNSRHPEQEAAPIAVGNRRSRLLIVGDQPVARQGMAQLINRESDLITCQETNGTQDALKAAAALKPDLVVVDLAQPWSILLDFLIQLNRLAPTLPILVIGVSEELFIAERFLDTGARGYILSRDSVSTLLTAIRQLLAGGLYLGEPMATRQIEKMFRSGRHESSDSDLDLSNRETQVLDLLGKGLTSRQISELLHLSVKTIDTYRSRLIKKLALNNSNELIQYAIRWSSNHDPMT